MEKYNCGNTHLETTNRKIHIGKYKSKITSRKNKKTENTYRKSTKLRIPIGKIQIGQYKSEDTNWKSTDREIHIGKIQVGNANPEIINQKLQARKYKSENTNRK